MKKGNKALTKEIFAVILMGTLLSLTLYNTYYLDRLLYDISGYIDASEEHAKSSEFESAVLELLGGIKKWESIEHYTGILLRHTDIDCTSAAFFTLLSELYRHDGQGAIGSYMNLRSRLRCISDMENVSFRSIF